MNDKVSVCTTCPICHKKHFVEVDFEDYRKWKTEDIHVQDAFPYLSDDDREMLLSGICVECWNEYIKENDEEK